MSQERILLMAMELSNKEWGLFFTDGAKNRSKKIQAGQIDRVMEEIARARKRFNLEVECKVISCYEAGRDGFWIHRALVKEGIQNQIVDAASIEMNQRRKRLKTDRLDGKKLLSLLMRQVFMGEKRALRAVRVPSEQQEARMRLGRERDRLKKEINGHVNRLKSLLFIHGIREKSVGKCEMENLLDWEGKGLSEELLGDLRREQERLRLALEQKKEIESKQRQRVRRPQNVAEKQSQELCRLRGIGVQSAWTAAHEFFSWRDFKNRRQVGACAGLTGVPYDSGDSRREQGISKAGNKRIRAMIIELAWGWLRYQPRSALSQWFMERYGLGGKRQRRIGIVALARKLLVALWKYLKYGQIPEGAEFGGAVG